MKRFKFHQLPIMIVSLGLPTSQIYHLLKPHNYGDITLIVLFCAMCLLCGFMFCLSLLIAVGELDK